MKFSNGSRNWSSGSPVVICVIFSVTKAVNFWRASYIKLSVSPEELLTRTSHQFACCHRILVYCQYVMIICSLYCYNRLRLMRPRLSFCRQRARAPSTRATAMLSVPVSSTGQAPASADGTNLPGADLDVRRTPAGCAPWKAHI